MSIVALASQEKVRHKCDPFHKLKVIRLKVICLTWSFSSICCSSQVDPPSQPSNVDPTPSDIARPYAIFNEFFKWSEDHQKPSSIAFVAHIGTSFVGLNQSTSHRPWLLDSGATHRPWLLQYVLGYF